jgi:hypothetical protein
MKLSITHQLMVHADPNLFCENKHAVETLLGTLARGWSRQTQRRLKCMFMSHHQNGGHHNVNLLKKT